MPSLRLLFVFADTGTLPDGTTMTCQMGPDCTYQRYVSAWPTQPSDDPAVVAEREVDRARGSGAAPECARRGGCHRRRLVRCLRGPGAARRGRRPRDRDPRRGAGGGRVPLGSTTAGG